MKYAYFPGCSAESTARDMHVSTTAVARALGIELVEPRGWTCCGATAAHQTDPFLAAALPAANLAKVKDSGLDMVVSCAACYNRMKVANHELSSVAGLRLSVLEALGREYDGSVKVRHFMEILLEDLGEEALRAALKQSLNGLPVASYYGCLLVRPHEVTGFDDPENPTCLDRIVTALGGRALEWPHKVECCGGGLSLTRTDVVVSLTESILDMARAAGAACIAVACPMCQINLDMRQLDIEKRSGKAYRLPVVYITQLIGLCLGLSPDALGLDKLMVPAADVIHAVGGGASPRTRTGEPK
jgi:heterodisulfide reductase subunit B2